MMVDSRSNKLTRLSIDLLSLIILIVIAFIIAKYRSPDWTDEGLYLYDAWTFGTGNAGQDNPVYRNQGYFTGWPVVINKLFALDYTVLSIRFLSTFSYLAIFYIFCRSFLIQQQTKFLSLITLFFALSTLYFPTLSYQTIPLLLFALATALSLRLTKSTALAIGFLSTIPVLAYVPAVFALPCFALGFLCFKPLRQLWAYLLLGSVVAISVYLYVYQTELANTANYIYQYEQSPNSQIIATAIQKLKLLILYIAPKLGLGLLLLLNLALLYFSVSKSRITQNRAVLIGIQIVGWMALAYLFYSTYDSFITAKASWYRDGFINISILLFPITATILCLNPEVRSRFLLFLIFTCSFTGVQILLGTNQPRYYLSFLAPYLFFFFIVAILYLGHRSKHLVPLFRGVAIFIAITFSVWSIITCYNFAYRGKPISYSSQTVSFGNLKGVSSFPERVGAITLLNDLYIKYSCQEYFFAAIDRTPLAYLIVDTPSPWGLAWIGNRDQKYSDELAKHPRVCLVFRSIGIKGQSENTIAVLDGILEFIGHNKNKINVHAMEWLGDGDIYFLAYDTTQQ